MKKIELIQQLQDEYLDLVKQARDALAAYKAYTDRWGTRDQRDMWLRELKAQIAKVITVSPDEHPDDYDSRHNLRVENGKRCWTNISGCPSCDRINDKHGITAKKREIAEIQRYNTEAYELQEKARSLHAQCEAARKKLRSAEDGLLPGYNLQPDGNGRITATGPISNVEAGGKVILDTGTYVDYEINGKTALAVFDASGQLAAYHSGDGNWVVTATWEKYTSSVNRDTGIAQTNFFTGTIGETDQKKKVHIAIDEFGDILYVRDMDGTELYDRKRGIGFLPPDLNWDR